MNRWFVVMLLALAVRLAVHTDPPSFPEVIALACGVTYGFGCAKWMEQDRKERTDDQLEEGAR